MSKNSGPITLEKMMKQGGKPDEINLEPIKEVLGKDIPHITPDRIGKFRLSQALRNKFGVNFMNIPQAKKAYDHFEGELKHVAILRKLRGK